MSRNVHTVGNVLFQKYFITFRICRGSEESKDEEAYDFADIG